MLDSCRNEQASVRELIEGARMAFAAFRKGNVKTRLEMHSPRTDVPLKINISELMAETLPDSPGWYNVGSCVSQSFYWGLRDVDQSGPGESLALTPNMLDVGAAAESAISASALMLDHCGRMTDHDPAAHVQRAQQRRVQVDALMKRATTSAWAHVPAEPHGGRSSRLQK